MGYCYCARTGRLACDACGASDGKTRKRTCPHRVHYAEGGSLPYCQPSALCPDCYAKHKPTLHASCKEGAAAQSAKEAERAARRAAGELERKACWGAWHANVPDGFVGALFVGGAMTAGVLGSGTREEYRLLTKAEYDTAGHWLSDYPNAQPWIGPNAKTA